ncbi:SMI1/KNR4 family protein [Undibacterium terreum]|uniref:Knr4/Smi1-like domain-containing protein n=1 Tax=Undibacterium terreum TaxID=1224302 RepID=A0A916XBG1_9BURK|nr:SMI1/KNR4 family protein [Undibacterium terreum]GGC61133.1 hypothetical protein GCM10011396_05160 [Undibacterium terreum]
MKQHLNAIKQLFADKNSLHLMQLNPGASNEELDALEQHLGVGLPADFKEYLSIHDGQAREDGLIFEMPLLSIAEIKDVWDGWCETEEETSTEDNTFGMCSIPEGYVKPMYTNPKWIAFTKDHGGNHIGLDLDPDIKGTMGQVIIFGCDEHEKRVLASSFTGFLAMVERQMRLLGWSVDEDSWYYDDEEKTYSHYHEWIKELQPQINWRISHLCIPKMMPPSLPSSKEALLKTNLISLTIVSSFITPLLFAEEAVPARLGMQLDLQPSADAAGNYVLASEIRDLVSNQLLGSPKQVFSNQAPASIEIGVTADYTLKISVDITQKDQGKQKARCQLSYSRDGEIISQQNLNFGLKNQASA